MPGHLISLCLSALVLYLLCKFADILIYRFLSDYTADTEDM